MSTAFILFIFLSVACMKEYGRLSRWKSHNVTPSLLVSGYQDFEGIYCCHFQGKTTRNLAHYKVSKPTKFIFLFKSGSQTCGLICIILQKCLDKMMARAAREKIQ